jgi:hypothetical protein
MTVEQLEKEAQGLQGRELGRALYVEAQQALSAGASRAELISALTTLYDRLGEQGREDDQDAVADVLDALEGFSSPTAAL